MRTRILRIARIVGIGLAAVVLALLGTWATLALYYSNLPWPALRLTVAAVFALGFPVAFVLARRKRVVLTAFLVAFVAVAVWWSLIPASNDRDWVTPVAVLPRASFDGDVVTLENVRDFDYRTADEFTPRYEDWTFSLADVESVDLVFSYWEDHEAMAHTFLTFGLADGRYLAASVEARREKTEKYEPLPGIFKQYELVYVFGTERDLIGLRHDVCGERVYLHPSTLEPALARRLLERMLESAEALAERPVFYSTIARNCTTTLVDHLNAVTGHAVPFQKKILLNGYSDRLAHEVGLIASPLPFDEMKRRHLIQDGDRTAPDFSARIRANR